MVGIYKITNRINGKVYIGLSTSIETRFTEHKRRAKNKNFIGYNYPLYAAMRKYGVENFKFEILERCDKSKLKEREIYYISQYKSNDSQYGYNLTAGGDFTANIKIAEDIVDFVIDQLKRSDDSMKMISDKIGVSDAFVSAINNGTTRRREHEEYPIRPQPPKKAQNYCCVCGHTVKQVNSKYCTHCAKKYSKKNAKTRAVGIS